MKVETVKQSKGKSSGVKIVEMVNYTSLAALNKHIRENQISPSDIVSVETYVSSIGQSLRMFYLREEE